VKKKIKVLLVFDTPVEYAIDHDYREEFKEEGWETESDIYNALIELGCEVRTLGICKDITTIINEIKTNRPEVIFNLTEVFDQRASLDKNFVGVLEMLGVPYTGSSAKALFLCNDKALHKKILRFHRIRVPRFQVFYRGHRVWLPKKLKLPFIVKPLSDEASRGISLASIVDNESALIERVRFIHEKMQMDAIIEEYIDGRELYASVIGSKRIRVLPFREMKFGTIAEDDEPRIATYKAKWDLAYRKKRGMKNVFPGKLAEGVEEKIIDICKRAYRALNLQSYARFDIRVASSGRVYIIEANANPNLAKDDELAQSADKAGITYARLVQDIISLAQKANCRGE